MHLKSLLKTNALIIITLLTSFSAFAQAPNLLNYQGVARNSTGNPLPNQTIKLRLSIHDLLPSGAVVYSEIRQITTNMGGLFSVQVGSAGASSSTGTIAGINWLVGNKFLQVELDPTNNNSYLDIGTAQLVSVPYAFMSGSATTVKTNANLTGVVTSVGNATSIANGAITSDMIGTLNKSKVGLDLVNNTSDASKPISDLTKAALDLKVNVSDVTSALETKVDKVAGKDLSSNDYTTDEKNKLATITGSNSGDQDLSAYATKAGVDSISSVVSLLLDAKANIASPVFTGTVTTSQLTVGQNQYPTTMGTSGQVLTTNGSGTLTWTTVSGSGNSVTTKPTSSLTDPFDFSGTNLDNSPLDASSAQNLANGLDVLKSNNTGIANVGFGINNLYSNTTGSANTSVGFKGLYSNTTGQNNSSFGTYALYNNTTGNSNSAFGSLSLISNTTGTANSAIGEWSMLYNTTGSYNTATGLNSLFANDRGNYNTANGFNALYGNYTGSYNTAIGASALNNNGSGAYNTGVGVSALKTNSTGSYSTAIGSFALYSNTTGNLNTAVGYNVLYSNTTGYQNTAIGREALYSNTTGYYNTANGSRALRSNTTGIQNTATGLNSLYTNTTGENNTANGAGSLFSNSTGMYNSAFGSSALSVNTTGSSNTAVGMSSLFLNTTGNYNTAVGLSSLHQNTLGSNNTGIGYKTLYSNITGENNTAIGYSADVASNSLYNATAIGYQASVTASNTIQLGNTNITNVKTSGTITAGAVTYPNTNGITGQVLSATASGTITWTTVSSSGAHTIGESYGGGIVFYTWDNGLHGLIAATNEIGVEGPQNFSPTTGIKWGPTGTITGAYRFGVGGGFQNTDVVIAKNAISGQQYFDYAGTTTNLYAAFIAQQYSSYIRGNVPNSSFGDWYLPSMGELNLFYANKNSLSGTGYNSNHIYWSSTEVNSDYAYELSVGGGQNWDHKSTLLYVLPIRKF